MDLLPALSRNSVLDGVWNDESTIRVSLRPFRCPSDQASASWGSIASVLVNIKFVSIVAELDESIDLPRGNNEIAVLALVTVSAFAIFIACIGSVSNITCFTFTCSFGLRGLKIF